MSQEADLQAILIARVDMDECCVFVDITSVVVVVVVVVMVVVIYS